MAMDPAGGAVEGDERREAPGAPGDEHEGSASGSSPLGGDPATSAGSSSGRLAGGAIEGDERSEAPSILIVDNYDSFTYNLAQEMGELGADVEVVRNDRFDLDELAADPPDGLVISPGPGRPDDAGLSNAAIEALAGRRPVLGVCLGHQCVAVVHGGRIVQAPELVHGKTSLIYHRREGVLADLPLPFEATRYHSLVVERESLPAELKITAETSDGLIMGLRHREIDVEGVQFHPESVLTGAGMQLLGNFLARCRTGRSASEEAGARA